MGQKMERIPILFLSSEAYSPFLCVAMASLLDNKADTTFYEIYVMTEKSYAPKKARMFQQLQKKYQNFSLQFVLMDDAFEGTKVTESGVGKETMYRLLAAEKLPNVERCIYLDSDTIVLSDLTAMYHHNIGDNYISGIYPEHLLSLFVKSYKAAHGENYRQVMKKNMGLEDYDYYIGAGVMIMNLRQMRDDNMTEVFLNAVKPNSMPTDQDVLNTCCYGRIARLPMDFCIDLHELNDINWFVENHPARLPEIHQALANPVVIHFADRFKPWKTCGLRFEKEWWRYATQEGLADYMWDVFTSNAGLREQIALKRYMTYDEAYAQFRQSTSYRLGLFLTFIPRKIYHFFRRLFKLE